MARKKPYWFDPVREEYRSDERALLNYWRHLNKRV